MRAWLVTFGHTLSIGLYLLVAPESGRSLLFMERYAKECEQERWLIERLGEENVRRAGEALLTMHNALPRLSDFRYTLGFHSPPTGTQDRATDRPQPRYENEMLFSE